MLLRKKIFILLSLVIVLLLMATRKSRVTYSTGKPTTKKFLVAKEIKSNICGEMFTLPIFPKSNPDKNQQVFFLETSNRTKFNGRTICAFESALRVGNLPVKLFFRAPMLKIDHPALCSLVKEFYPHKLSFYTADLDEFFSGTPLQGITSRLEKSQRSVLNVQMSDLMRGVFLYKYGGFYFDQDVLTLKDLTRIRNTIVLDNVTT